MLAENITLNTIEYRLQVVNPTSSLRVVSGLPFGTGRTLKVSHDKTGKGIVNSAVTIDVTAVDTTATSLSFGKAIDDRVMVKFSYDTSVSHNYTAALTSALADLVSFLSVPANVTMILNQEH